MGTSCLFVVSVCFHEVMSPTDRLHSPPGTGKTSLSFALAGVFGLDIYCLALSESTLTEEDLILLFNNLPQRSIILLEDIDSAGLTGQDSRNEAEEEKRKKASKKAKSKAKVDKTGREDRKQAKKRRRKRDFGKTKAEAPTESKAPTEISLQKNTITISGLLNAIDGVASQEGRVLIMTTNHPEKLDDALVRPGRVDLKIEFGLSSKQQIEDIFLRMYCFDSADSARQPTKISQVLPAGADNEDRQKAMRRSPLRASIASDGTETTVDRQEMGDEAVAHPSVGGGGGGGGGGGDESQQPLLQAVVHGQAKVEKKLAPPTKSSRPLVDPPEIDCIEKLAEKFADALPEATFSPAEIQGFLLVRKMNPMKAVLDIAGWRDEQLQKMRAKTKKKSAADGEASSIAHNKDNGSGSTETKAKEEGEEKKGSHDDKTSSISASEEETTPATGSQTKHWPPNPNGVVELSHHPLGPDDDNHHLVEKTATSQNDGNGTPIKDLDVSVVAADDDEETVSVQQKGDDAAEKKPRRDQEINNGSDVLQGDAVALHLQEPTTRDSDSNSKWDLDSNATSKPTSKTSEVMDDGVVDDDDDDHDHDGSSSSSSSSSDSDSDSDSDGENKETNHTD